VLRDDDSSGRVTISPSLHAQLPSADERRAAGRAARDRLNRSELAGWERGAADPVATIAGQNAIRLPELLSIRHSRMATSPWAFYRGAAAVMASDLGPRADTGLTVQLCGDAHILHRDVCEAIASGTIDGADNA
jgi:hypothetical protein